MRQIPRGEKYLGVHVESFPDVAVAPSEAAGYDAYSFSLNLVNPKDWRSNPITEDVAQLFKEQCKMYDFTSAHILPHASFIPNLASPDSRKLAFARTLMVDEFRKAALLGLTMVNFHPGAHLNQLEEEAALERISHSINYILSKTEGVCAVIENTAGQGSNLGYTLTQIGNIIAGIEDKSRVGVCIDTCHAFAAGYNLTDSLAYHEMWDEFDNCIGAGYLKGIHLNDSVRALGSRIDRHASIGKGCIGMEFFQRFMNDERFNGIPIILETPDPNNWKQEIETLYSLVK
ncbi:MAG: deoxyribonuclease IV [Muribaculaceae bacterium]|nr:deoxyribonuclease IV [Muribaculaceae bacterium]